MRIPMLDHWSNFFVMVGGGAAALAGLVFVAMSINPAGVVRDSTHRHRAINMLNGFICVFMACSLALMGRQTPSALGAEWLVLWTVATIAFVRGYVVALKSGTSVIGLDARRLGGGTLCYIAECIGSVLLLNGNALGLEITAVASVVLFAFLISGAWLLFIGSYEPPTS